jgi:hypothetical protein
MIEQMAEIDDSRTARELTLALLAENADRRVLRVSRHLQRPVSELITVVRYCDAIPKPDMKAFVAALSNSHGMRSFSGEPCHQCGYIGNNPRGKGFYKPAVYCQSCGYAMGGIVLNHIQIVTSDDLSWNQLMLSQCELGADWYEGTNYGITYEFLKVTDRSVVRESLPLPSLPR